MARVIGIDLGTTNTLAAWADGRVPRILPTERGHNLLPSVVAFVAGADGNEKVLVGHSAKEQLLIRPRDTVYGGKRLVGRPFHSPQVQGLAQRFAYEIVEGKHGQAAVRVNGRVHELTEISAILLQQIARYARASLGGPVDGVVISVPAYYPLSQREAIRRAGAEAGLDVWRLVNEPTAAALAYGIGRNVEKRVLVFDLGGGTFDVSILEIAGGTYQVLATGGDGFLGGVDFDIRLTDHLIERFEAEEGMSIRDDAVVVQRVLSAAEVAKCDLSLLQHVEVRLPFVGEKRGRPVDMALHVSRAQLLKLTEDLIERCIVIVDDVLRHAGLRTDEIDEVLLAGGQTRMPAVQSRLEKQFGKPPRRGVNPDEVVAQGAALLARSLGSAELRLLDVLSVPIGVGRSGRGDVRFEEVLRRNITLPTDAVIEASLEGNAPFLDVFQGSSADPVKNEYLGTLRLEGLPRTQSRVPLRFHLDAEGLLEVTADLGGEKRRIPLVAGQPTLSVGGAPIPVESTKTNPPDPKKPTGILHRLFGR